MPDVTIFIAGFVTFLLLLGGLWFTVYEMRAIAGRAMMVEGQLKQSRGPRAVRADI